MKSGNKVMNFISISVIILIIICLIFFITEHHRSKETYDYYRSYLVSLTPEQLVAEYVNASFESNEKLLQVMTNDERITFSNNQNLLPIKIISIGRNLNEENKMKSNQNNFVDVICFDTILEFVNDSGNYLQLPYFFTFSRENEHSPWILIRWGF